MILATDVHYDDASGAAQAAGLAFVDWADELASATYLVSLDGIAAYEPGAFYRRELPCLLRLIEEIQAPLDGIIVDGHVWLGAARKGLGAHLYDALGEMGQAVPIIGVAKNTFRGAPSLPVLRGTSTRPLHVTAIGMTPEFAAAAVLRMHGPHRLPTLLKQVDRLCRDGAG